MSRKASRSKKKEKRHGPHVDIYANKAPDISPWMRRRMKGEEDTPAIETPQQAPVRRLSSFW